MPRAVMNDLDDGVDEDNDLFLQQLRRVRKLPYLTV